MSTSPTTRTSITSGQQSPTTTNGSNSTSSTPRSPSEPPRNTAPIPRPSSMDTRSWVAQDSGPTFAANTAKQLASTVPSYGQHNTRACGTSSKGWTSDASTPDIGTRNSPTP